MYRYLHGDGVGGGEGAFVLCGFRLAEGLVLAGRLDEAQEVFVAHAEISNHLGLRLRDEGSSKLPRPVSEATWGLPRLPS
jgi:hypothetical protein